MKDSENQIVISEREPFLVMYHGSLTTGRGIESLIQLVALNPHVKGIILGNGENNYVSNLHNYADELKVDERILFHPAVHISELWKYVGAVDLSLMMILATTKSYYFALPNKFFESIQALTPIIASDFPEMKRLIDQYEIGLTCDPSDMKAINRCVEKMRTDSEFYNKCKQNLVKAKEALCWNKERQLLISAFEKI